MGGLVEVNLRGMFICTQLGKWPRQLQNGPKSDGVMFLSPGWCLSAVNGLSQ